MEETAKKVTEKYMDFWAKYNLTSRISIFLFLLVYVISAFFVMSHPINAAVAKVIMDTTSYVALITILSVIFGPNTFVKIAEIITDKKFKGNVEFAESKIKEIQQNQSIQKNTEMKSQNNSQNEEVLKAPKLPKDI